MNRNSSTILIDAGLLANYAGPSVFSSAYAGHDADGRIFKAALIWEAKPMIFLAL
jgi:hypothetical protein